jgi:hypothetical protein
LEPSNLALNGNASALLAVANNMGRSIWLTSFRINPALNATAFAQEIIRSVHEVYCSWGSLPLSLVVLVLPLRKRRGTNCNRKKGPSLRLSRWVCLMTLITLVLKGNQVNAVVERRFKK